MADDPTFRLPRTNDPFRRAAEPRSREAPSASDPLAELARLIGRSDPYAQFGVTQQRQPEQPQAYPASSYGDEDRRHASSGARSDGPRDQYHSPRAPVPRSPAPSYHEADDWRSESEERYAAGRIEPAMHVEAADDMREPADERESDQYIDDATLESHDEQIYDDPPRARRRSGLATALALIGCAMLGTAAAYGYRSYSGHVPSNGPPPVITADSSPSKITPSPGLDSQSGKVIQERVANAGKEQVVTTQEEPVALKDLGTQAAPRVILPAPVAPLPPGSSPAASSSPGSSEPKKVRTLTIHPDGTDVSGRPVDTARTSNSAANKPSAPPRSSGGPLSLAPQSSEPAPPAARTRTATLPPSPAGGSGSNFVQLSSQKTEAEAEASFRSLQAKFPNELGGRQGVIRRADLGSKGVFYRAMVGPFASSAEASQFCANYKSLGGHCVVPNN